MLAAMSDAASLCASAVVATCAVVRLRASAESSTVAADSVSVRKLSCSLTSRRLKARAVLPNSSWVSSGMRWVKSMLLSTARIESRIISNCPEIRRINR